MAEATSKVAVCYTGAFIPTWPCSEGNNADTCWVVTIPCTSWAVDAGDHLLIMGDGDRIVITFAAGSWHWVQSQQPPVI